MKRGASFFLSKTLIADEEFRARAHKGGYIKRTNPNEYRKQKRGGVGVVDLNTKDEDFVTQFLTASAHSDLLFFSDRGKAYQLKMYEVPEGKRATKGKAFVNFLSIEQQENYLRPRNAKGCALAIDRFTIGCSIGSPSGILSFCMMTPSRSPPKMRSSGSSSDR